MTAQDTEISVTESEENVIVEVCVVLKNAMMGLDRDVIINLNTVPGTAGKYQQLKVDKHVPYSSTLLSITRK